MKNDSRPTIFDLARDFADGPRRDARSRWLYGAVVPGLLAAAGMYCLVFQHAFVPNIRGRGFPGSSSRFFVEWTDASAVLLGIVLLLGAFTLHCHSFWSGEERTHAAGYIGKMIGVCGLIVALAALLYHEFFLK